MPNWIWLVGFGLLIGACTWIVIASWMDIYRLRRKLWDSRVRAGLSPSLQSPYRLLTQQPLMQGRYQSPPYLNPNTTTSPSPPSPPSKQLKGHVIGFREWIVDRGEDVLRPRCHQAFPPWRVGANEALCHSPVGRAYVHPAPGRGCQCGLYAFHSPYEIHAVGRERVVGAVVCWGNIEVHSAGIRAQWAMPVAIVNTSRRARRVAERYHCVLVDSYEELEQEALRHGQRVPKEIVPPRSNEDELRRFYIAAYTRMQRGEA